METVTTLIAKEPQNVQFPNPCFTYSHIQYSLWKKVESKCVCYGEGKCFDQGQIISIIIIIIICLYCYCSFRM